MDGPKIVGLVVWWLMRNCRTMCIFHHQLSIRCRDAVMKSFTTSNVLYGLLPTLEPGVVYNSVCCSKKADEWNRRSEKIGSPLRSSVTGMCTSVIHHHPRLQQLCLGNICIHRHSHSAYLRSSEAFVFVECKQMWV